MEDVKQMVTHVLDSRGVLSRLKAELRANVFMAINDHDVASEGHGLSRRSHNDRRSALLQSEDGRMVSLMVKEFMDWAGMGFTGQVYDAEAELDQIHVDRQQLCEKLGMDAEASAGPILLQLLQQRVSGGLHHQQAGVPVKQPMPSSNKAAGEPVLGLNKLPRTSTHEEGEYISTSIYETVTGALRPQVSHHSDSSAHSSAQLQEEVSLPPASSAASSRRTSAHDSGSAASSSRRVSSAQRSLSDELELPDSSGQAAAALGPPSWIAADTPSAPVAAELPEPAAAPPPPAAAALPSARLPPRLGPLAPLKPIMGRLAGGGEASPRLPPPDKIREELLQAGLLSPRPSLEPGHSPSSAASPSAAAAPPTQPPASTLGYDVDDSDSEAEGLLAAAAQVLGLPPAAAASGTRAGAADDAASSAGSDVLDIPEDIIEVGQDLEEDYSNLFAEDEPLEAAGTAAAAELEVLQLQLEESANSFAHHHQQQEEDTQLHSSEVSMQLQASGLQLVDRSGGLDELLSAADHFEDAL